MSLIKTIVDRPHLCSAQQPAGLRQLHRRADQMIEAAELRQPSGSRHHRQREGIRPAAEGESTARWQQRGQEGLQVQERLRGE